MTTRITAGLIAVAAALVAVLWLRPAHSSPQPAPATLSVTSTFIPLPFARPFRQAEQVGMYRVRMPEAALASYGLPTSGQFAGLEITADVLVGEDGTARAIRFVHTEDLP